MGARGPGRSRASTVIGVIRAGRRGCSHAARSRCRPSHALGVGRCGAAPCRGVRRRRTRARYFVPMTCRSRLAQDHSLASSHRVTCGAAGTSMARWNRYRMTSPGDWSSPAAASAHAALRAEDAGSSGTRGSAPWPSSSTSPARRRCDDEDHEVDVAEVAVRTGAGSLPRSRPGGRGGGRPALAYAAAASRQVQGVGVWRGISMPLRRTQAPAQAASARPNPATWPR